MKDLASDIVHIIEDLQGSDVVVLDLRNLTSFTDFFVICSGQSDRQVQAIADEIQKRMKADGRLPIGTEGYTASQWILLDYGNVVVHIFMPDARDLYQVEKLWADAPRLPLEQAS